MLEQLYPLPFYLSFISLKYRGILKKNSYKGNVLMVFFRLMESLLFSMCKRRKNKVLLLVLIFSFGAQPLSWFGELGYKLSKMGERSSVSASENLRDSRVVSSNEPQWWNSCSLELKGVPFRVFLQILEKQYGFTFFLDRRVNPDLVINVSSNGDTCMDVLEGVTRSINLGFCVFDNSVIFIAPPSTVRYSVLLYQLHNAKICEREKSSTVNELLSKRINFEIEQFREYKETIGELSRVLKLKFDNLEKITFELSEGSRYEQVNPSLLLTLLLLGFDADYEIDSQNNQLKPLKLDPFQDVFRSFSSEQLEHVELPKYPNCRFEASDVPSITSVRGPFNEVAELEYVLWHDSFWKTATKIEYSPKATANRRPVKVKKSVITGEVANTTLKDLFAYLKTNADITCSLDKGLQRGGITLSTRISCQFKNFDIDDISKIIATQIQAKAKISENRIVFYKDNE